MQCQQWEISGYPKSSSDVLKADRAPPADALELLPERLWRTWIAVGQSTFYLGQFLFRARPGSAWRPTMERHITGNSVARWTLLEEEQAGRFPERWR